LLMFSRGRAIKGRSAQSMDMTQHQPTPYQSCRSDTYNSHYSSSPFSDTECHHPYGWTQLGASYGIAAFGGCTQVGCKFKEDKVVDLPRDY